MLYKRGFFPFQLQAELPLTYLFILYPLRGMSPFFPALKILALSHSFNHRTYYEHVIHCIALSELDDINFPIKQYLVRSFMNKRQSSDLDAVSL